MTLKVVIHEEKEGGFWAEVPALPGCATQGETISELKERVTALRERGIVPGLGTVLVGSDPGSQWYVAGKHRDCAEVGMRHVSVCEPALARLAVVLGAGDEFGRRPPAR